MAVEGDEKAKEEDEEQGTTMEEDQGKENEDECKKDGMKMEAKRAQNEVEVGSGEQ